MYCTYIQSSECLYVYMRVPLSLPPHRNCLTWRDVQSILVYSAVKVDVSGAEWVENGAGFHHSDQHGFGLMDAYRLTTVARAWPLLPEMVSVVIAKSGRGKSIPPNRTSLLITLFGKFRSNQADKSMCIAMINVFGKGWRRW